ncbi:DUF4189 domain-containing protein [Actimicrobium antarcticum]|uniref:DUF4189 domain-containing protein n=1 Tax=Actimicrobium antarcticum TaxID=1051899 RepID=A0ABP7T6A3_9BURK
MPTSVIKKNSQASGVIGYVSLAAILLFVFIALPGVARASASSIAYGSDDSWAWATRATQREANQLALQKCNETTPKKDCALDRTKAIVRADGGGSIGLARSAVSLADARKSALANCGNTSCKVLYEITKSGFYSLAQSEKDKEEGQNYYLMYAVSNSDEADKEAIERCTNLTAQKCKVIWSGAIAGHISSHPRQ